MGIGDQIRRLSMVAMVSVVGFASAAIAQCQDDRVTITSPSGPISFDIELAITPAQTSQGLMFRESLDANAGMLFFFTPPRRVAFWMRNTLIPLDMIFIDARGVVRKVHENAVPGDETSIPGAGPTRAVLEINGGRAAQVGITVGSLVQHALFDQSTAALPCP